MQPYKSLLRKLNPKNAIMACLMLSGVVLNAACSENIKDIPVEYNENEIDFAEQLYDELKSFGWNEPTIQAFILHRLTDLRGTSIRQPELYIRDQQRRRIYGQSRAALKLIEINPGFERVLLDDENPKQLAETIFRVSGDNPQLVNWLEGMFAVYNSPDAIDAFEAALRHNHDTIKRVILRSLSASAAAQNQEEEKTSLEDLWAIAIIESLVYERPSNTTNLYDDLIRHISLGAYDPDETLIIIEMLNVSRPYLRNLFKTDFTFKRDYKSRWSYLLETFRDWAPSDASDYSSAQSHQLALNIYETFFDVPEVWRMAGLRERDFLFKDSKNPPRDFASLIFGNEAYAAVLQLRAEGAGIENHPRPALMAELDAHQVQPFVKVLTGPDIEVRQSASLFRDYDVFHNLIARQDLDERLKVCVLKNAMARAYSAQDQEGTPDPDYQLHEFQVEAERSASAIRELCDGPPPTAWDIIPGHSFFEINRRRGLGLEPQLIDYVGAGLDIGTAVLAYATAGTSTAVTHGSKATFMSFLKGGARKSSTSISRTSSRRLTREGLEAAALQTARRSGGRLFRGTHINYTRVLQSNIDDLASGGIINAHQYIANPMTRSAFGQRSLKRAVNAGLEFGIDKQGRITLSDFGRSLTYEVIDDIKWGAATKAVLSTRAGKDAAVFTIREATEVIENTQSTWERMRLVEHFGLRAIPAES